MLSTRLVLSIFSFGSLASGAGTASCQDYPNKPIRMVTSAAGSGSDFVLRLIAHGAQGLSELLGQPVIVENFPTSVIADTMARAMPDGYTVLVIGGSFWTASLFQKLSYDPLDYSPISSLTTQPYVVVVHPSLPVKSVKELIALAKARPGDLNYGTILIGSTTHLAAELFKSMAGGLDIVRINYKGTAQYTNALLGGEVQLVFSPIGAALPHIKSGKMRALAVTSEQPSALLPALPTVAASGLAGFEAGGKNGMFAPPKTPAVIVNRLNQEAVRALNRPDVKAKLLNSGVDPVGSSPKEFAASIKSNMTLMAKVIKDAGIKPE